MRLMRQPGATEEVAGVRTMTLSKRAFTVLKELVIVIDCAFPSRCSGCGIPAGGRGWGWSIPPTLGRPMASSRCGRTTRLSWNEAIGAPAWR